MAERDPIIRHVRSGYSPAVEVSNVPGVHDSSITYRFTLRELEVLKCRRDGMGLKQIAAKLGISPNTVKVLIDNVIDRNSPEDGQRTPVIPMLLAAEKSGLLGNDYLETLRKIADGTFTLDEGIRALEEIPSGFKDGDFRDGP